MASLDGQLIAERYVIEKEIGRGGMAVVYRALDTRLNRTIALKLLHPYLASQPDSAKRFEREAEAIAKLHHNNIVEIYDTGHDDFTGSKFIVMELIDGPTLAQFIQKYPTQIPYAALCMTCSMANAIHAAHQAGIIHRDIKPENIMITHDGVMKLTDFGIAHVLDADKLTASGSLIGSPAHMPPEIIEGLPYSFSCDIFSLGTVLYFTLTNTLPFKGNTPMAIFKAILDNRYTTPGRMALTIPKNIDQIVAKCLKTNPDERFHNTDELKKDILAILTPLHLDNYDALLKNYFSNPNLFNQTYIPKITTLLNQQAAAFAKSHATPRALEYLNCILAYEPQNPAANALLKKLRGGQNLKKIASLASLALLILSISFSVLFYFYPSNSATNPQSQTSPTHPSPIPSPNATLPTPTPNPQTSPPNPPPPHTIPNSPHTTHSPTNALPQHAENSIGNSGGSLAENAKISTPKRTRPSYPSKSPHIHQKTKSIITQNSSPTIQSQTLHQDVVPNITLTQPVFPPDAFAVINGKKYTPNASGDILIQLPPGNYQMTLSCPRCTKKIIPLSLSENSPVVTRDIISLDWADASLTLIPPDNQNVYFIAHRIDDRSRRILHYVAQTPNAVNGFNAFGKPILLEIYAIPQNHTLRSYDANALENAKLTSTRVALEPGESKTIRF